MIFNKEINMREFVIQIDGDVSEENVFLIKNYISKIPKSIQSILHNNKLCIYITDKILKSDNCVNGLACPEKNYIVLREKKDKVPHIYSETLYHEIGHMVDYYLNTEKNKYFSEEDKDMILLWNQEKEAFCEVFNFKNISDVIDIVEGFAYIFSYIISKSIHNKKIKKILRFFGNK